MNKFCIIKNKVEKCFEIIKPDLSSYDEFTSPFGKKVLDKIQVSHGSLYVCVAVFAAVLG